MLFPLGVTAVMLPDLDFAQQIALCRELGVTHYTYRPRVIPDHARDKPYHNWGNHRFDLTPQRLVDEGQALRKQLEDAGLTPFGTVPGANLNSDEETLRLHFKGAAEAGAGRVRVQPKGYPAQGRFDFDELLRENVEGFRRVCGIAAEYDVKVVIELHAGSFASSPGIGRMVVREFDPERLGVIFDLANFNREGALAPNLAVNAIAPWIDHCHVGGFDIRFGGYDEAGFRAMHQVPSPLDQTIVPVALYIKALHDCDYRVPLVIEDYTLDKSPTFRLQDTTMLLKRLFARLEAGA